MPALRPFLPALRPILLLIFLAVFSAFFWTVYLPIFLPIFLARRLSAKSFPPSILLALELPPAKIPATPGLASLACLKTGPAGRAAIWPLAAGLRRRRLAWDFADHPLNADRAALAIGDFLAANAQIRRFARQRQVAFFDRLSFVKPAGARRRLQHRRFLRHGIAARAVEIGFRRLDETGPELILQDLGAHFLDRALAQIIQMKGPERNPDQSRHLQTQMLEHALDLAILALAQIHHDPGVFADFALENRDDRAIFDTVERDPMAQRVQRRLIDLAMHAHAVAPQPRGIRMREHAGEPAIIGEQHQAFGIDVETAHRDHPAKARRQMIENRWPAFRIGGSGHQATLFVIEPKPRALALGQRLAIHLDMVLGLDIQSGAVDDAAIDRDAAREDPGFRLAPRAKPGAGHDAGDALARLRKPREPRLAPWGGVAWRCGVGPETAFGPSIAIWRGFTWPWRLGGAVLRVILHHRAVLAGRPSSGEACEKIICQMLIGQAKRSGIHARMRGKQKTGGMTFDRRGISAAELGFNAAFAAAREAGARDEVPIGAAIMLGGDLVAKEGNQMRQSRDPTAHAEMLAIRAACAKLGAERLGEADLYVTLEPCPMCAAAIGLARIRRLYYAASDPKGGGVETGPRIFSQPTCHHAPEIYAGIRESEAAALLRAFFKRKRQVPQADRPSLPLNPMD